MTLKEQIEAASAKATQAELDRAYYGSTTFRPEEIAFRNMLVNAYRAGKLLVIEDDAGDRWMALEYDESPVGRA